MKRAIAGFCLLVLSAGSAISYPAACCHTVSPTVVHIVSTAADKTYGLLVAAPEAGCRRVRYRIDAPGQRLLGKTPVMLAGQVAIVRIGNGFARGLHSLIVTAEGCAQAPDLVRRVTLHKASPDHGWRAGLVSASLTLQR